jgi:type I restriction enzyme S subunit
MSALVGGVNESIEVKNDREKYDVKLGIREWKRYSEYRDSEVDWIGEIPKNWDAIKIKRLCQVKRGASPRPIDNPIYFDDDGDYAWVRISDVTTSNKYLIVTEQKLSLLGQSKSVCLEPGSLFLSIAGSVGKPIITKIKCCIHDGFVYFEGLKQNSEYLFYLFSCGEMYKGIGKLGTQLNLNTDTIGDIKIPISSPEEEHLIVNFLDRETSKIDTLIEKKQRLIELLEEKRSALISKAVTKGLDADMKMKDSGIEWIRMIPENWEMTKNGLLFNQRDERDFPDLPILQVSISKGVTLREFSKDRVEQMAEDPATYKRTKKGDIVFNKMRMWQGAIGVAPQDGLVSPDYTVAKPIETVNPRYFELQFRTDFYKTEVNRYSYGIVSDRNRLYWDGFKQIKSISPPFEEQNIIVNFLDRETEKIDTFINKISAQIEKLKEYRTALISAAVTGKIDVREEVA